jgi:hypothetical protein
VPNKLNKHKSFCPIITRRGRPNIAHAGAISALAHQLYWDFERLENGSYRPQISTNLFQILISDADKKELGEIAIREGQLKANRIRSGEQNIELATLAAKREWIQSQSEDYTTEFWMVPNRKPVLEALLGAQSVRAVKQICEDSYVTRTVGLQGGDLKQLTICTWPISPGSVLPMYLSMYARVFVAAKNDKRFPRSGRPSSRAKQLWFLARTIAGAVYGVRIRTSQNLVGSKRPDELFEESHSGKPRRVRTIATTRN